MLELKDIVKCYTAGEETVTALDHVTLRFRKSEFVSILGPSGCGKTTMLNIIGGLDRYTEGDLIINGRSTKEYRDGDWDTYRNHSIGFVFQSYNLIPHQTVLANVELALTLSGVSKTERRRRAADALRRVGLGDQLHKKPNQLSGGQMQRVAIARALVNNPDILLADEPTGALDTATSVQIMELLKEVARDRLVIMVTHNPELAAEYSTRIVKLSDGRIVDDSAPFEGEEHPTELASAEGDETKKKKKAKRGEGKKTSMSFATAFSLSLNNLMTKKTRTILTAVAGSIGIIGIALILSLSNGIQNYIDRVQEDALSTYPLSIQKTTTDYSAMLSTMTEVSEMAPEEVDDSKIYVDDSMGSMMSAMSATVENDLVSFKKYIEEHYDELEGAVSDIQYTYDFDLQIFTEDGKTQVNPTTIFDNMGDMFSGITEMMDTMGGMSILSEMIGNQELLDQQYELVGEGSEWADEADEVMLVIGKNNQISKMTLYMLGVLDQGELEDIMSDLMTGKEYESAHMQTYELEDFLGMKFRLLNTQDFFAKSGDTYEYEGKQYPVWYDIRETGYDQESFVKENGMELRVAGIIRPRDGASATSIAGAVGYTKDLTDLILQKNTESEIIAQQKATPKKSVLSGAEFERVPYERDEIHKLIKRVGSANMQRFYGIMTAMILDNEEYRSMLQVTPESIAMFIGVMEDEPQAVRIAEMLANAAENDTGLVPGVPIGEMNPSRLATLLALVQQAGGEDGLTSVPFTKDNLVDLLPLLSETQVMLLINGMPANPSMGIPMDIAGLKDLCTAEKMEKIYAEMNVEMNHWTVNEKSMSVLLSLPQMTDDMYATMEETLYSMVPDKDDTYESVLKKLGDAEQAAPASINFYAKDFESKDTIEAFIADYNDSVDEAQKLEYTDMIGILMSSVSTIINVISYVLIAFVSISLVVSSIMIGIITYISVLERTKEIGILRAIGASKKDISRVFNAETLLIGLTSGLLGIAVTLLLCWPINAIIHAASGITTVSAALPWVGGVVLVLISMLLTFVAGLIPSGIAAKKDPVVALRTE